MVIGISTTLGISRTLSAAEARYQHTMGEVIQRCLPLVPKLSSSHFLLKSQGGRLSPQSSMTSGFPLWITTAKTSASKLWMECSFNVSVETLVTQSKLFVLSTSVFRSKSGDMGTNCACGCACGGMMMQTKERGLVSYVSSYLPISERMVDQPPAINKLVVDEAQAYA